MKKLLLALLFLLVVGTAHSAHKIAADLSEDFIAITEGFDGAHLTVFGVVKEADDVAVVFEGPRMSAKVRKKERQMGVWINGEPTLLENVPGFYAVLTSKPHLKLSDEETVQKNGLALDALEPQNEEGEGFRSVKRAERLYQQVDGGVVVREKGLFRARVDLPANVPIGSYNVKIFEFSKGKLLATRTVPLRVGQVGVGAKLSDLARRLPIFYAMMTLALSLGIGAGAAFLFRRKS